MLSQSTDRSIQFHIINIFLCLEIIGPHEEYIYLFKVENEDIYGEAVLEGTKKASKGTIN